MYFYIKKLNNLNGEFINGKQQVIQFFFRHINFFSEKFVICTIYTYNGVISILRENFRQLNEIKKKKVSMAISQWSKFSKPEIKLFFIFFLVFSSVYCQSLNNDESP